MKYRYLIMLLFLILLVVPASADWLSGYDYRKSHNITGNTSWGGTQTNYQMQYLIYRSSGTDSGNSVYVGTSCQADYDDIRFTTSDGITLCDYWIESSTSALATVWVEVPSIATTNTTIYIYYGNAAATPVSSGLNTFPLLFEDCSESSLNTTRWTVTGGVEYYSGLYIRLANSGAGSKQIESVNTFPINSSVYFRLSASDSSSGKRFGFSDNYFYHGTHDLNWYVDNSSGTYHEFLKDVYSSTYNWRINVVKSGSTYYTYHLYESYYTNTETSPQLNYPVTAYFLVDNYGTLLVENVRVQNTTYYVPVDSIWSSSETSIVNASSIASSTSIVPNTVVTFTNLSTGYITNWSYDLNGDGTFDNVSEQNPSYKYTVAGVYNVSLKVNNTYRSDWENKTSYIYVGQPPIAAFYGDPLNGTTPLTVAFTDTSTGGTPSAWNWSFGDGEYSESQNPSHIFNTYGNYTVSLNSSNAYGADFENKTEYIVVSSNSTESTYGSQYPPHTVRFVVQDYYGNPIDNLNVVATSTQTTMQWGWLKNLFGINDAVDLRYTSMSGTTGADGGISFIMLETIGYSVRFYNTTQGIDHTELLFPQEQEYLIHIHTQNEMNFTPSTDYIWYDLNYTTESNESMTFYGYTNISAGYVNSIRFYVEWSNGTILHEETKILPVIETFVYNVPLAEGESIYYGFNITSTSFGNKNPVKAATFPDDIDWQIPSEYLGWAGAGLILLFAAIFTRGTIEIGLVVLPIVALLLTMMNMIPVTIGAPATVLLFLGILIYIRNRYSG